MHTKFLLENLNGREHLRDLWVDGRIPLKCVKELVLYGVDWIHPVQERAQQRILMNAITLRVP
jgi:hypothetical protein